MKKKIVVGITGASGAPYAGRLLSWLEERAKTRDDVEVGVCLSATAPEVWKLECGGDLRESLPFPSWGMRDYKAPFASGSAGWHAMVVVPCSMGTAARIAHGISDTLLTRAADVMLKERRSLIVVPRETPLSAIHLENLAALARAGALILPAMPSFYGRPTTLEQAIDTVIARILDHLGLEHDLVKRWGDRVETEEER
jgi:4-hydroxy-3-polyprenylbenzoate decarboxylase